MSVTLEDKEDLSGNPLLLVSHIKPMELGGSKNNETDQIPNWKVRLVSEKMDYFSR